jgi:acetolactate synthase-1/2/3 large subunit
MYTNQALWTQAREQLNVITVIFNNQRYGILETEYLRLGVNEVGEHADALFALNVPAIDFAGLAKSMGVPGTRVMTCDAFQRALDKALLEDGPSLIEVML